MFLLFIPFIILGLIVVFFGFSFFPSLFLAFKDILVSSFSKRRKISKPFDLYGVHIFCGRVGCGKSISMVRRARNLKRQFPKLKIYSNFTTTIADEYITCWQDVVTAENIDENGVNQGVLFLFDEIHLTFDSQSWKDAPDNLLEYISLQRHMHKCIFGASQVWSRVNKVIREQTDYVIECKSYLKGRLIKNTCYTNEDYQINGSQKDAGSRKRPKVYQLTFTATDELRGLYDTEEIIKGLSIGSQSTEDKLAKRLAKLVQSSSTL